MRVFGLTGGVGMGKTTVAGLLQEHGVPVVDTDDLARQLVQPGQPALEEICQTFGANLKDSTGELRRDALAKIVFADATARSKLEAILHPRIRQLWKTQLIAWREEGRSAAAVVIPLLYETQAESEFDSIICVACSEATQRRRLTQRGWSQEQITQRIAAQLPINEKMLRSTHVVWTEGDLQTSAEQLSRIFS